MDNKRRQQQHRHHDYNRNWEKNFSTLYLDDFLDLENISLDYVQWKDASLKAFHEISNKLWFVHAGTRKYRTGWICYAYITSFLLEKNKIWWKTVLVYSIMLLMLY